jgi:arginine decarboxylase
MAAITVTTGTGKGETAIAAFDSALLEAGIANYNLIRLSSIIPPGSVIERQKAVTKPDEFGHKLYLVYASQIEQAAGKEAWAGIGWVMAADGSGKGLFTEHEAGSEKEVRNLITKTLTHMVASRPEAYGNIESVVTGITSDGTYACALVAAVYESEGWNW